MSERIPVRTDERFDVDKVMAYLRKRIAVPDGEVTVEQFPAGASNLTYLLRVGEWEAVLRRPPLGPVAPKAHDMARESWILQRLHPVFPLAPRPLVRCEDPSVIGTPFYVMERRRGIVLDKEWSAPWPLEPEVCRQVTEGLVRTLAELHAIDYREAGLADIGRPKGYLERQVQGWIGRYERARTDEIPEVEPLCRWLVDRLPTSPPATIIHNDYKLNNVMLDPAGPGRLTAVLDWEMATVGDPLCDIGALMAYWGSPEEREALQGFTHVTALPEFPRREEVLELYARFSGRDVSGIDYYLAFSYFKIAVICQQIYFRWKNGQTKDPRFGALGQVAAFFIRRAHGLCRG